MEENASSKIAHTFHIEVRQRVKNPSKSLGKSPDGRPQVSNEKRGEIVGLLPLGWARSGPSEPCTEHNTVLNVYEAISDYVSSRVPTEVTWLRGESNVYY